MTLFLLVYVCCFSLGGHVTLTANHRNLCVLTDSDHLQEPLKVFQDMSEVLPDVDPKAALSTVDLVKLLLNHCNSNKEEGKKRGEAEQVHTDNKIKAVIDGFGKQLSNVIVATNLHNSDQADRIRYLELKLETLASYQEQLLYSIMGSLQDTQIDLNKHIDNCHANNAVFRCDSCDQNFQTSALYEELLQSQHQPDVLSPCDICGIIFTNRNHLTDHIERMHGSQMFQSEHYEYVHVDATSLANHNDANHGLKSSPY